MSMIFLRSLVAFYSSLFSAYVHRDDVFVPLERPYTDGTD